MSTADLQALSLDPEQVERAVDFELAYFEMCEDELATLRENDSDEEGLADAVWTIRSDAATALNDACEWMILLDPMRGMEIAQRAGSWFAELGYTYGLFLLSLSSHQARSMSPWLDWGIEELAQMWFRSREPGADFAEPTRRFPMLAFPQQQAYLALASVAEAGSPRSIGVDPMTLDLPHENSAAPMGPMGVPLRRYWLVARSIATREPELAVAHLIAMARTYGETIESAMTNRHTWRHAATPVAVGDLDLIGMTHLAHRAMGNRFRQRLEQRFDSLSPIEVVPLRVGLSLQGLEPGGNVDSGDARVR